MQNNKATVKVMKTHDKWIGITYAEDTKLAQESFRTMVKKVFIVLIYGKSKLK